MGGGSAGRADSDTGGSGPVGSALTPPVMLTLTGSPRDRAGSVAAARACPPPTNDVDASPSGAAARADADDAGPRQDAVRWRATTRPSGDCASGRGARRPGLPGRALAGCPAQREAEHHPRHRTPRPPRSTRRRTRMCRPGGAPARRRRIGSSAEPRAHHRPMIPLVHPASRTNDWALLVASTLPLT